MQFTGLLGAGLTVAAAAAARKAQRPWPLIVRTIFRPPQWYCALSVMVLSAACIMIGLSFLLFGDASRTPVRAAAIPFSLLFVWFLVALVVAERHLIRRNVPAADRSILMSAPSWQLSKIKSPAVAAILDNKPAQADQPKPDVHDSPTVRSGTASDPDGATTPLHP